MGRSAEDELMDWFTEAEVKQAVEDLPEQFRLAVLLADVEGFSYKEIADIMGTPIGTVMSRLSRARQRLRQWMSAAPADAQAAGQPVSPPVPLRRLK
mgnify:CR=1 FL=1